MKNQFRFALVTLLALVPAFIVGAVEPPQGILISPSFDGRYHFDRFTAHKAIEIGDVIDMRGTDDPTFLGYFLAGLNNRTRLATKEKPEVYVRSALESALGALGLRQQEGETPAFVINVAIWRAHAWVRKGFGEGLYCVEANLVFELKSPSGELLGRIYTLGDAQLESGTIVTKKKAPGLWQPVFDAAFADAFQELVASAMFCDALGPDVLSSVVQNPARIVESQIQPIQGELEEANEEEPTHIDYGPWMEPSPFITRVPKIDFSAYSSLEFEDFEMGDKNFVSKTPIKGVKRACAVLPEAVFARLASLYPGLFDELVRGDRRVEGNKEGGKRLILQGRYRDFKAGNIWAAALIGWGAGRVSFDVDLSFVDADSGQVLSTLRIDVIHNVTQLDSGDELEEVIDRSAADIVHYLQRNRNKQYVSPVLACHLPTKPQASRNGTESSKKPNEESKAPPLKLYKAQMVFEAPFPLSKLEPSTRSVMSAFRDNKDDAISLAALEFDVLEKQNDIVRVQVSAKMRNLGDEDRYVDVLVNVLSGTEVIATCITNEIDVEEGNRAERGKSFLQIPVERLSASPTPSLKITINARERRLARAVK